MRRQGSGWKGESRRHSLARKGVKTVLPDGRRFDVSKFVARGVQKKWHKILDALDISEENPMTFSENVDVDFYSDSDGQSVTYWITIPNPLIDTYGEDIPDNALEIANDFFRKQYVDMNYDDYHLKNEDYVMFWNTIWISDEEVEEGFRHINNKEKLNNWLNNIVESTYYVSSIKTFDDDWGRFYRGEQALKMALEDQGVL